MNDPDDIELSRPFEEAASWLVRHDAGLSAADEAEFAAWLAADPANAAAWETASEIWDEVDAEPDPLLDAMRQEALRARPFRILGLPREIAAAAAAIALLVLGVQGYYALRPTGAAGPVEIAMNATPDLATRPGQRIIATLADDTRVTLDTDTAIATHFTAHRRDLRLLRGQALFEVAHDASKPFTVAANERFVTATGTVFSVRVAPQAMATVLAQGRIAVTAKDAAGEVTLAPGQRFAVQAGSAPSLTKVDLDAALAWREGYLQFDDTPLAQAAAEMNRYAGVQLKVADARTGALRITGRFRGGDAARFAETIAQIYPVRVQRAGNVITLGAAN